MDFAKANNVSIMLYDNDGNVLLSYSYESALTVQEDTAFMGDTDSTELLSNRPTVKTPKIQTSLSFHIITHYREKAEI